VGAGFDGVEEFGVSVGTVEARAEKQHDRAPFRGDRSTLQFYKRVDGRGRGWLRHAG